MLEKFERYALTFGPTPIEPLPRLTEAIGGDVEIWAKREDCNSGLARGGNKLRKLEYIVPDAIASGADTLVSIGGVQSNHTRMVAAVAAKIGMKCRLVQESWVPHEDAVYDRVGNILLTRLMGADSRLVDEGFDIGIRKSWEDAMQDVRDQGGRPYGIPAGASVHKFGGLGYVGFAEEVRAQEAELGFSFDYIIVCVVTGSTQAGMIVGFKPDGRAGKVIGIDASGTVDQTRAQVTQIARQTADLIELGQTIDDADIIINPDYAYPAYGVPSAETNAAIRLAARTEAMITDPVYEGKSMQGMIDLARKGFFRAGSRILFAHLGGSPALNGYAYTYRNGGEKDENCPVKIVSCHAGNCTAACRLRPGRRAAEQRRGRGFCRHGAARRCRDPGPTWCTGG
jgi:1-aminocyclopropane-1-carboxylate deaminase